MSHEITPELLQRLLDEHGAALELFAAQWTEAAEDCVQEAFLQLVRQPSPPDRVVAWLFRVVRNRAISLQRAASTRRRHESAAARQRPWFQNEPPAAIDDQTLTAALRALDDQQREVVVARIWGGLSFEQIGEVIGASSSSAHRRYEAGLRQLRTELQLDAHSAADRQLELK